MSQLDTNFIKPFVDATLNTLKVQCQTEAVHEKPFIKGTAEQPDFEIAAVIALTSDAFTGSITICFTDKTFLSLMGNMLGETFPEITKDLQDGASELMNIIYGQAKVVLNQQGYKIQKAIPTVIRGKALSTSHYAKSKVMVLPFKTPGGPLQIEICAEESMS